MNIINKKLFDIQYKELSDLDLSEETIGLILKNNSFKKLYNTRIIPLLEHLKYDLDHGTIMNNQIDFTLNTISQVNGVKNMEDLINKIENHNLVYDFSKVINSNIISNKEFENIYERIGYNIFLDNISNIILSNNEKELFQIISKLGINYYDKIILNNLNSKVINFILNDKNNKKIDLIDFIKNNESSFYIISNIINNNYEDGLTYVLNNLSCVENILTKNNSPRLFDINFINNIDEKAYKNIFKTFHFCIPDKFVNIIFKIYDIGNYELINDIFIYDATAILHIDEDYDKDIYYICNKYNTGNKERVFKNKEFKITEKDNIDILLLCTNKDFSICKYELLKRFPLEFEIYDFLINADYDELKNYSSKYTKEQIKNSIENIKNVQKYLSSIERITFIELIKNSYDQLNKENISSHLLLNENKEPILSNSGKEIKVFELDGEPFTMMVHSITQKKEDGVNNGKIGNKLQDNPEIWDNEENGNPMISTSIIDNKNFNSIFSTSHKHDDVIYGFINIPEEAFYGTFNHDAGTNMKDFPQEEYYTARMNLPSDIMNKNGFYNEVIFNRKNLKTNEKFKPDYLVCYDKVDEKTIKHAQYFCIPIYVINTKIYQEQLYKEKEILINKAVEQSVSRHI